MRTIMIYDKTQGHNCDTENKPVIGRMHAHDLNNWTLLYWVESMWPER